jgi:hypothetical protein
MTWDDCKALGYSYSVQAVTLMGEAYAPDGTCLVRNAPLFECKRECIRHAERIASEPAPEPPAEAP